MKKVINISLVFLLFSLLSLNSCVSRNEFRTHKWIKIHEKPTVVLFDNTELGVVNKYILIDNEGEIFKTKYVKCLLPDTIFNNILLDN